MIVFVSGRVLSAVFDVDLYVMRCTLKACNFTKINTPPWVFFTFFKLYKWYQIVQRIRYKLVRPKIQEFILRFCRYHKNVVDESKVNLLCDRINAFFFKFKNGVFEFTDVPAITYYKGKEPWSIGLTFLNGKCFIARPGKIKTGILDIHKLMKLVDKFCKELREENYTMITSLPLLIIFYINFKNKLIVCTKLDYAIFHDISLSCLENHGTIKKTD